LAPRIPDSVPPEVQELLQKTDVGYLSVMSPKGQLYSYPIAFYFAGRDVYFVTPVSSAKLKFIRASPRVSLIVDNRKLTRDAVGSLIQGDARVFTISQIVRSIISVGSAARGFTKKYPGMLSFYAKGKGLPDERKLHKYRMVRINPTSIVYWVGYKYGRCNLEKQAAVGQETTQQDEMDLETVAGLFQKELPVLKQLVSLDDVWLASLDDATSKGGISTEEQRIIRSFADRGGTARVTIAEKSILEKWRASEGRKEA